jgi:hypothetical protein
VLDVLVEETGEIEGLVVAHPDPERKRWAEEVRARTRPTRIDDDFDLTARVMRTGEPAFLRQVPQELIEEAARRDPVAAAALEQTHAVSGTYAETNLAGFGVTLVRADTVSYCIQTGVGTGVQHETGPGGAPAAGPC